MKRACDNCGKPYHRRNVVESWTEQNPGHCDGWRKEIRRICIHCQDEDLSKALLRSIRMTYTRRRK